MGESETSMPHLKRSAITQQYMTEICDKKGVTVYIRDNGETLGCDLKTRQLLLTLLTNSRNRGSPIGS